MAFIIKGTNIVGGGGAGGGSSTLADLGDVNLSSPSDGQNLSYNAALQKWENKTLSAGGHNYSTTEQVVGTWVDGKKLYEKTLVIPFPVGSGNSELAIQHGIIDIFQCVYAWGGWQNQNNGSTQFNRIQPTGSTGNLSVRSDLAINVYLFDRTKLSLSLGNTWASGEYMPTHLIFILQYTKTTD